MADQVETEIPDSLDGSRVDKAIADLFEVSRAIASQVVADGVLIDGFEADASDRVRTGQVITCRRPDEAVALAPEPVEFVVLHEDQEVIVAGKPAGVVVHPAGARSSGTLAAGLLERYPELEGVGAADRWGLVHRLDKDTSGTILVARSSKAYEALTAELRRREIERVYTALVEGGMGAPTGTVDAPIGRDPSRPTRRAVVPGGKQARTHYEVDHYYETSDVSLVEVRLETGRTHQIRVHMAAIGHPVAGDVTYGASRRDLSVPRTFLHASKVTFTHPTSGECHTVEAPLPTDLATVLDGLS